MSRARNIKPSFFSNEDLAELPFEARLLFIGLWTLADREGRLEDRPKRIKMALFPADNIDAEQLLNSLQTVGLLKRYVCDGFSVIQITNFVKHQSPHGLEKDSELPDEDGLYCRHPRNQNGLASGKSKPEFYTKQQLTGKNNSFQTVKERLEPVSLPCHNRLNPECGILNPECGILNPESNTEEEKKVEKKESPLAAIAASPPPHFSELPIAKAKPKRSQAIARPEGVADAVWQDWLALRKAKKAAVTATVLAQAESEAAKAGMSLNDFFSEWCLRGSQGLKAEWLLGDRGRQGGFAKPKGGTVNGVGVSATTVGNVQAMQEYFAKKGQVFHAEIGTKESQAANDKNHDVIDV